MCTECGWAVCREAERNNDRHRDKKRDRYITPVLAKGCAICGTKTAVRLKNLTPIVVPPPSFLVKYAPDKILEFLTHYTVLCTSARCKREAERVQENKG